MRDARRASRAELKGPRQERDTRRRRPSGCAEAARPGIGRGHEDSGKSVGRLGRSALLVLAGGSARRQRSTGAGLEQPRGPGDGVRHEYWTQ